MNFLLFSSFSYAVEYSLAGKTLTISGTGTIDKSGVRSKGNHQEFQRIIINNGPNTIEKEAFQECFQLQYIFIPASVLTIKECFYRCFSLSEIVIDEKNSNYYTDEQHLMFQRTPLTLFRAPTVQSFTIPEGVVAIEEKAFGVQKSYKYGHVVIPKTVKTLHEFAFVEGNFQSIKFAPGSQLKTFQGFTQAAADELVIPSSVTSISLMQYNFIGKLIFEDGINLEKIVDKAFLELMTNNKIIIPDSVTTIGANAFARSNVTKITIGTKCSSIDETAISGCSNLKEIIVKPGNTNFKTTSEGVLINSKETQILFLNKEISSINIPGTVNKISKAILQNSKSLTNIVLGGTVNFNAEGGLLYTPGFTELVVICGGVQEATLHSSTVTISKFAASNCNKLKKLTIQGTKLTTIDDNSFVASGLTSLVIPISVKTIGGSAFGDCTQLTDFTIPHDSQITTLRDSVFRKSAIKEIFIPKGVNHIYYYLFDSCTNLQTVTFHEESELTQIDCWAFQLTAIKSIVFPKKLNTLQHEVFRSCHNITKVGFVPGCQLKMIGERDFEDCTSLETVSLPPICETIKNSAFKDCTSLSEITHSVTTIEAAAFRNCVSLLSFQFSTTQVRPIPSSFQGCSNLEKFTISGENPNIKASLGVIFNKDETELILFPPGEKTAFISARITKFSNNAFAWSTKLCHVAFDTGSNLDTICESTFLECTALQYFQFPTKLKKIDNHCFEGCSSIKKITLPESLSTIGESAFYNCRSLSYVKYCGIKAVQGTNVFDKGIKIGVTEYYNGAQFCGVNVRKELSVDCELIFHQVSCKIVRDFLFAFSLSLFLVF